MTSYQQTIDFLFNQLPAFEKTGSSGYKPGLERVLSLSDAFGNPHLRLKRAIHVAGTNGKGSTAHTLAAILGSQGYNVGLFTSPHLVDFRERIRVNGEMIPEEDVVRFVERFRQLDLDIEPSFFELTTIMAFDHFVSRNVDVAVVEVGLGGRLDSTNIISPILSIITNIALDHTALLGDSRQLIAREKAGIIKDGVPVIVGETDDEISPVFKQMAHQHNSELIFAESNPNVASAIEKDGRMFYDTKNHGEIVGELTGICQIKNTNTILAAVDSLKRHGLNVSDSAVRAGFINVGRLTGLAGRWQIVSGKPLTILDTGHNPAGWRYTVERIDRMPGKRHIVIGFVADKDVDQIIAMIAGRKPENVSYYFVSPSSPRALRADDLRDLASSHGLFGECCQSVAEGCEKALSAAGEGDSVFIGGSNYVVAEAIPVVTRQR